MLVILDHFSTICTGTELHKLFFTIKYFSRNVILSPPNVLASISHILWSKTQGKIWKSQGISAVYFDIRLSPLKCVCRVVDSSNVKKS